MAKAYAAQAAELIAQGVTITGTAASASHNVTKVDGYSQDIANDEVSVTTDEDDFDTI